MLLRNPYEIGVAYVNGQPIGKVESEPMVLNHHDPDHLRPYIEKFLREEVTLQIIDGYGDASHTD